MANTTRGKLGEIALVITAALTPQAFADRHGPVLRGDTAATTPFKPTTVIGWAEVDARYSGAGIDATVSKELRSHSELGGIVLVGAVFDGKDLLPGDPVASDESPPDHVHEGVSLATFAGNSIWGGVSWPSCDKTASLAFRVTPAVLTMLESVAPDGYNKTPTSINVAIHFHMIGPALV